MAPKRLPPMNKVEVGKDYRFVRTTTDGRVSYAKKRMFHVLEVGEDGVVLVAFHQPVRNIFKMVDKDKTFRQDGFNYCRWLPRRLILDNCREKEV